MKRKLRDIAFFLGGQLVGDGGVEISGINGIKEAGRGDIAFLLDPRLEDLVSSSSAGAVIVPKACTKTFNKPVIKVDNPSIAFSRIINFAMPDRIPHPKGVHPASAISKTAKIGRNVAVGAYAVIEDGAVIGDGTVIYALSYVGKNSRVGRDGIIYPNVTVREEVIIGDRVIIHPGSVIGSDGFGFDTKPDGTQFKIPQIGTVEIEDDVEIGACVTIDRARFNKTLISKGTKIDNLVQIAHNVTIGAHSLIAAQTGISGSTRLGRNAVIGGQVGIADHLSMGDFFTAGAKSGITKSFNEPHTTVFWYPAKTVGKMREILGSIGLLPKLFKRVNALEAKVKELEKR